MRIRALPAPWVGQLAEADLHSITADQLDADEHLLEAEYRQDDLRSTLYLLGSKDHQEFYAGLVAERWDGRDWQNIGDTSDFCDAYKDPFSGLIATLEYACSKPQVAGLKDAMGTAAKHLRFLRGPAKRVELWGGCN